MIPSRKVAAAFRPMVTISIPARVRSIESSVTKEVPLRAIAALSVASLVGASSPIMIDLTARTEKPTTASTKSARIRRAPRDSPTASRSNWLTDFRLVSFRELTVHEWAPMNAMHQLRPHAMSIVEGQSCALSPFNRARPTDKGVDARRRLPRCYAIGGR